MIRLNYTPEIRSLLCRLETAGFRILSAATNGDPVIFDPEDKPAFVSELATADDATVRLASPQSNRVFRAYLTTGNEPGELVADTHCPAASPQEEIILFRRVIAAHADFWCEQEQAVCAERD